MQNRYIAIFVIAAGLSLCGCGDKSNQTLSAPPPVGTVPVGADNLQAREAAAREAQKQAALNKVQIDVPKTTEGKAK